MKKRISDVKYEKIQNSMLLEYGIFHKLCSKT